MIVSAYFYVTCRYNTALSSFWHFLCTSVLRQKRARAIPQSPAVTAPDGRESPLSLRDISPHRGESPYLREPEWFAALNNSFLYKFARRSEERHKLKFVLNVSRAKYFVALSENERQRANVLRTKFDRALRQRLKISIFEGFFRKTRKMNDGVLSVLRVKFDRALRQRPKISIFEGFFRKTRKMNDGVLSVLRTKFDRALRQRPKNLDF